MTGIDIIILLLPLVHNYLTLIPSSLVIGIIARNLQHSKTNSRDIFGKFLMFPNNSRKNSLYCYNELAIFPNKSKKISVLNSCCRMNSNLLW